MFQSRSQSNLISERAALHSNSEISTIDVLLIRTQTLLFDAYNGFTCDIRADTPFKLKLTIK